MKLPFSKASAPAPPVRRRALQTMAVSVLLLCLDPFTGGTQEAAADTSGSSSLMPEVDVVEKLDQARDSIVPNLGATSYSIPDTEIEVQSQGDNAPINQTILRAPGVAAGFLRPAPRPRGA